MATTIDKNSNNIRSRNSELKRANSIAELLENTGRFPPINLTIKNLQGGGQYVLDRFRGYSFQTSVLVPVDTFSFSFVAPDDPVPFNQRVRDGDIAILSANGTRISTGILDTVDVETNAEDGETGSVEGRDLLGQFEDQDAISFDDKPLWADQFTVSQVIRALSDNCRLDGSNPVLQQTPSQPYLFATEPGESKLSALQRYLEPLHIIAWMRGDGRVVIGKPNMAQRPKGKLILSKQKRECNVMNMKATFSSTQIANIMVPIWSGQEFVQDRVSTEQRVLNAAEGPSRLRKLGHRVPKSTVVSTPQGSSPQELAGVNQIKAASANLLQAHAKRELARANVGEVIVQAIVPGHYDENGDPFVIDSVYNIEYDRAGLNENMYLFEASHELDEQNGPRSILKFCRLGRIVSDVRAP